MELKWLRTWPLWAAVACFLAAVPVYAKECERLAEFDTICYMVDFLDYDGSLLDSRLCAYGERIEDTVVPLRQEDERYVYEFAGWEPQFSEIVTECMAYTAVYRRIEKSGGGQGVSVSGPDIQESPMSSARGADSGISSVEIEQASSTSYDVTPFHIGTSENKTDVREEPEGVPTLQPTENFSQMPGKEEKEAKKEPAGKSEREFFSAGCVNAVLSEAASVPLEETDDWQSSAPAPSANSLEAPESAKASVYAAAKDAGKASRQKEEKEEKASVETRPDAREAGEKEKAVKPAQSEKGEGGMDLPLKSPPEPSAVRPSKQQLARMLKRKLSVPFLLSGAVVCCSGSVWINKRRKERVEK